MNRTILRGVKVVLPLCVIALIFGCSAKQPTLAYPTFPDESEVPNVTLVVTPQSLGAPIRNTFSDLNQWNFRSHWHDRADNYSNDYFKQNYPFVERVQFMTATGGSYDRDLFIDPRDTQVMDDYDFEPLIRGVENVVRQGLCPMIKTGAVPMKYSSNPIIGGFGVNVCPPDDYDVYYNYIRALAESMVSKFGLEEVRKWSWGVLTEYENGDWFRTADNNPLTSREAYFKLYDYTVAALQDVVGVDNLTVGAHSMTCTEGLWDERDFIDHVANGVNYKTGQRGTQINFLSTSYYDLEPGKYVPNNLTLRNTIDLVRQRAVACGLTNLKYGVDEGRILNGPIDNKPLTSRIVAHTYQSSADALMFKEFNEMEADWFSAWSYSTEAVWGGVKAQSTYVAELGYRMVGYPQCSVFVYGVTNDHNSKVNGMCAVDKENGIIKLMVYNFNPSLDAKVSERLSVVIDDITPKSGKQVSVQKWVLDDNHANFWTAWVKDMSSHGVSESDFRWSSYSVDIPSNTTSPQVRDLWYSKEAEYKELAKLNSTSELRTIDDRKLNIVEDLAHHAVVFYEISNVKL